MADDLFFTKKTSSPCVATPGIYIHCWIFIFKALVLELNGTATPQDVRVGSASGRTHLGFQLAVFMPAPFAMLNYL